MVCSGKTSLVMHWRSSPVDSTWLVESMMTASIRCSVLGCDRRISTMSPLSRSYDAALKSRPYRRVRLVNWTTSLPPTRRSRAWK
ncbi:hypothetical protein L596_017217 [Steinernema carpocapsae]|uniref:Uncharacterized protein n=1 Tax=Steinernema carpocapsae TaxID=34508 RepID=A0A4U5N0Z3_STECR|nr:hypothetical protein L596_017217 [Steinernema carpocapsae]